MTYRARDWNEVLAKDLRDPEFAKELVTGLLKDGWTPEEILRRFVRAYGVKELSAKVGLRPQSISRILKDPSRARENTLKKIAKPFGVKISIKTQKILLLSAA